MDQTFEKKELGNLADQKIASVALLNDYLCFGTEKGLLSSYQIKSGNKLDPCGMVQIDSKKPVEKILVNNELSLIYTLCNGDLNVYSVPKLHMYFNLKISEDIAKIALNGSKKVNSNSILTISKKKKIRIYEYNTQDQSLKQKGGEISINESPELIQWYDNILCYKSKKTLYWLNLDNYKLVKNEMDCEGIDFIRDSIIVLQKELGIIMDLNTVKQFSPIVFSEKNILCLIEYKNYILSFHEGAICFYLLGDTDSKKFQTIPLNSDEVGKFILLSGKNTGNAQLDASLNLIYVTQLNTGRFKAYEIKEKPFQHIMTKLLKDGAVDDALNILNGNIFSNNENKMDIIEQFFLDASWVYFNQEKYDFAHKYARLTNFNPFEFIYTFYTLIDSEIIHSDCISSIKNDLSKNQIEIKFKDKSNVLMDDKPAFGFLMDLLIDKRNYLLKQFDFPKDNEKLITFMSSQMALIDLSKSNKKYTAGETLNYINSMLVKVMIKHKEKPKEIASIIDHPTFTCTNFCDMDNDQFYKMTTSDELKMAMAYYYEKIEKYEKALEIWEVFGSNDCGTKTTIFAYEAKDRTKKIFYKFKLSLMNKNQNMKLFEKYIKWLLIKFPEDAFEVVINTEIISIDYFLSKIVPDTEYGVSDKDIKEKFLIYYNNKSPNEKYQTLLIELFIDKLFKKKMKDTALNSIQFEGDLKDNYDLFMKYLKADNACFSKNYILDKIKDTWLLNGEIFLYSQLKMHSNALEKLIDNAMIEENDKFTKAEEYCSDNFQTKPEIYNMFLKMLINKYNEIKKKKGFEERIPNFEDQIISFLQKNKDVEKIDPVIAMEILPENFNICDERLYDYLTNVIKEYTSLTNKYKIERSISDMALTYKERELLEEKNKFVEIDNDTVCDLCKKKIGTTIFVVYPNMKIYHSKCAPNLNVCPTTGIDFQKKVLI